MHVADKKSMDPTHMMDNRGIVCMCNVRQGVLVLILSILVQPSSAYCSHILDLSIRDDGRDIVWETSGITMVAAGTAMRWNLASRLFAGDMGAGSAASFDFGWSLTFPSYGLHSASFGDASSDTRISPLLSSGFSLHVPASRSTGPLTTANIGNDGEVPGVFAWSWKASPDLWIHPFVLSSARNERGDVGCGVIAELRTETGNMVASLLHAAGNRKSVERWSIPYGAEPVGNGVIISLFLDSADMKPSCEFFSINPSFLARYAEDATLGRGFASVFGIDGRFGSLHVAAERLDLPVFLGAVGESGYRSVDAPMSDWRLSARREAGWIESSHSLRDRRWRPTAFAGDSQRRAVSMDSDLSMHTGAVTLTISWDTDVRWSRSGKHSLNHILSCEAEHTWHMIDVYATPSISFGERIVPRFAGGIKAKLSRDTSCKVDATANRSGMAVEVSMRHEAADCSFECFFDSDRKFKLSVTIGR